MAVRQNAFFPRHDLRSCRCLEQRATGRFIRPWSDAPNSAGTLRIARPGDGSASAP